MIPPFFSDVNHEMDVGLHGWGVHPVQPVIVPKVHCHEGFVFQLYFFLSGGSDPDQRSENPRVTTRGDPHDDHPAVGLMKVLLTFPPLHQLLVVECRDKKGGHTMYPCCADSDFLT